MCTPEYVASDPGLGGNPGEWWTWHCLDDNQKFNDKGWPAMSKERRPALWWDWHCIARDLDAKPEKFILVGFGPYDQQNVPAFVGGVHYYDLESTDSFESLCRRIRSEYQKLHSQ